MNKLRPVGTEYHGEWGCDFNSTDPREHRIRWRVKAHVFATGGLGEPYEAESIEALSIEYRTPEKA